MPIIGIFCFLSFIVQHLGISEKHIGIRFVLEGSTSTLSVSDVFGGSSEVFGKLDVNLCSSWWVSSLQSSWCYFLLFPVFWGIMLLFYGWFYMVSCTLVYLHDRGSGVVRGTASQLRAMSQEFLSLPSCFVVLWQRSSQQYSVPSLWWYFLCSHHSY